ncbi:hypothetical protein D3C85_728880 [compost metagenome]
MVEKTVVLIIGDEQHGLAPHAWVGHQGCEYLADVIGPAQRAGASGVFALRLGRQYPGNLRQRPGLHMAGQIIQRPVAHAIVVERRSGPGPAKAVERQAAVHGPVPVVVGVLVDAPADPGLLQHLGYRRPVKRVASVAVARVWPGAGGGTTAVVRLCRQRGGVTSGEALRRVEIAARPEHDAVGLGARQHRAVVVVAQREGFGQGEVEGYLRARVVAHGMPAGFIGLEVDLEGWPEAVAALIPGGLGIGEAVGGGIDLQRIHPRHVQAKRGDVPGAVTLVPDGFATGQGDREAVAEAANAPECAEVMIERAVLQHQDHHMLHILEGAGDMTGLDRQCLANRRGQGGQRRAGGCRGQAGTQEITARMQRRHG